MIRAAAIVTVALTIGGAGCAAIAAPVGSGAPLVAARRTGTITKVVDGDTVHVHLDADPNTDGAGSAQPPSELTIRLIGIDTPETHRPGTPVECFGQEAAAHLSELLPTGTPVELEGDVEPTDRYDRTLAYVHRLPDGLFVNRAQVEDGFAAPYRYPPNVAHADELSEAGRRARQESRGLWGRCGGAHVPAVPDSVPS